MKTRDFFKLIGRLGLIQLLPLLIVQTALAHSATWNLNPTSGDWNTAANWTPRTVPNGGSDIATFGVSNTTDLFFSHNPTQVLSIVFNSDASGFNLTTTGHVILTGAGIVNNSEVTQNLTLATTIGTMAGPLVEFFNAASAGAGTAINVFGTLLNGHGTGAVSFYDGASAGSATIFVGSGMGGPQEGNGGVVRFYSSSSAGDATFINQGAVGVTSLSAGARTEFVATATAARSTITANGGTDGGVGAVINFSGDSDGGTSRVILAGNGNLEISDHNSPGLTIGSVEGDGNVFLGGLQLSIGAKSVNTTLSGLIQDGGEHGGTGGSILKLGTGSLTLTGANTYTGGTIVTEGSLMVGNGSGSATGTGPVQVAGGILGGSGVISGAVTVGTGSGAGASLAPAFGSKKQVTLTLQSSLTLQTDAAYTYSFKARDSEARNDLVIANGVTINDAKIKLKGKTQGTLTPGTVITVISNTSASPISGTFSNLPDGSTITIGNNTFQADYEGGDGNDLTLTVVQ